MSCLVSGEVWFDFICWDFWLGIVFWWFYVLWFYYLFYWCGWWDFGIGVLGDMGCYLMDLIINVFELGLFLKVFVEGLEFYFESGLLWCVVDYLFLGMKWIEELLKFIWYEVGRMLDFSFLKVFVDWFGLKNGVFFVGVKGNFFVGFFELV